jgi:hypothetical protein
MEKRISLLESRRRGVVVAALFLGYGVLALAGRAEAQNPQVEKKESPFYCNIKTLSVAEREHKKEIGERMAASRVEAAELPNGYAFRFRPGGVSLVELADWVESERRCCPFFDLAIEAEREGGPVWLKITGREGVKQFITAELKSLKRE